MALTPNDAQIARFWLRVDKSTECWLWTGYSNAKGYGLFPFSGKIARAHRLAYQLLVGEIPGGLTLDHLCRNRVCVNPAHLEPVTNSENVLRGVGPTAVNAAATHCVHGHAFDAENTRFVKNTHGDRVWRVCRTCERSKGRRKYQRRKQLTAATTSRGDG